MSKERSMVESKPFSRKEAMHTLTTKFLSGAIKSSTVAQESSTNGAHRDQRSGFCGWCQ
eukprot:CAMPEP_0171138700 /NCGR_PEP_ID=MMETSP0766_2-20121228/135507_1 /TAXON_ID=439317 /ORGANISM="Gambierdiscus australes, Strain CAWD 149" /LENGTH=58 /DNA_ID=CAMNT_0011602321 /DNA_START=240 /DNA_END=416 /DNA_ORIENTATION=-